MEQAALDSAMRKLIERRTEQQLIVAQRGEKERRKQWYIFRKCIWGGYDE